MDFNSFQGDNLSSDSVRDVINDLKPIKGRRKIYEALKLANEQLFVRDAGMRDDKDILKVCPGWFSHLYRHACTLMQHTHQVKLNVLQPTVPLCFSFVASWKPQRPLRMRESVVKHKSKKQKKGVPMEFYI